MGFRVQGLGFIGSGVRGCCFGFRASGLEIRVFAFRVLGFYLSLGLWGLSMVQGFWGIHRRVPLFRAGSNREA